MIERTRGSDGLLKEQLKGAIGATQSFACAEGTGKMRGISGCGTILDMASTAWVCALSADDDFVGDVLMCRKCFDKTEAAICERAAGAGHKLEAVFGWEFKMNEKKKEAAVASWSDKFVAALKKAKSSMCMDSTRADLFGVSVEIDGGFLAVISTDGHRLTKVQIPRPDDVVLSAKWKTTIHACDVIKHTTPSMITKAYGKEKRKFSVNEAGVWLAVGDESGDSESSAELLLSMDKDFPNWRQVVPPYKDKDSRDGFECTAEKLTKLTKVIDATTKAYNAREELKAVLNDETKPSVVPSMMLFEFDEPGRIGRHTVQNPEASADPKSPLEITATLKKGLTQIAFAFDLGDEQGQKKHETDLTRDDWVKGRATKLGLSTKYLKEALKLYSGIMSLSIDTPLDPIVLRDGTVEVVIMPMRL